MPLISDTPISGGSSGFTVASAPITDDPISGALTIGDFPLADGVLVGGCAAANENSPLDILAALTEVGRELISRGSAEGLGYKVIGFRVGRGGYDPAQVLTPLPLNGGDLELLDPFYPVTSLPPKPIDRFEYPNQTAISFLCRVPAPSAIAGLGELGLYAEVTSSPVDPTEVGDIYLFAHVHHPIFGKTLQHVSVSRCVIVFTLGV